MRKKLLILPLALFGLVLTGCDSAVLKDNFTPADQVIETPWSEYSLPATGVEFAEGEDNITIKVGETHTYQYDIQPLGATANSLNWVSDNEEVATVASGVVTAVSGGKAVITASSPENAFDPVELNVNVIVPLTDFSLTVPEKLAWEEQYTFDVTYVPENTTERDLIYEISEANPADVVTLDGQTIIVGNKNGTAKLKVTGGENIVKEYTLTVNSVAVESISIADAGHEVEVDHTLELTATVLPQDAADLAKKGVKYYSKNPEIATIDENNGVVLGIAPGETQVYAKCGEVVSADYAITVYKVSATKVEFTTPDFALTNATDDGLTKQLAYQITTDRANSQPSNAEVSFISSNERVATVSETGLVTATGPGHADISVKVTQPGLDDIEDTVKVTVNIVSKSLSITGGDFFYNDSSLTLTAILTPATVSNDEIIWSIEQDPEIVSLSATTGASVTLTPVNNEVTGTVKVKAVNTGGASNEITVTVMEREAEFTVGHHYIVGSALYNSGESVRVDGKSSWTNAKYAYHFTYNVADPTVYEQFKGTIKFQAGDQFKYFVGSDYWVPVWEQREGWTEKGYHIQQDGADNAFVKGQMRFVKENDNHEFVESDAADANIEVVEGGWYDLYAKLYKNTDETLWYSLYIQKVANLHVEVSEITMGLEESYQIKAHDWIGTLTYTIKSGADLITLSPTGLVTGQGSAGTAVVTVNDDRNQPVDVTFVLQEGAHAGKTIYLNANGMFDTDKVVPFVHSWGEAGASDAQDVMMNKVEGQDIVYSASIPLDHTKIDFVRCPEGATSIVWENIYNQSKDQDIPNDKDMFTMTGWTDEQDGSHRTYLDGNWSVFDQAHVYTVEGGSGEQEEVDPNGDSYIKYGKDSTWNYLPLSENSGNPDEMMAEVDLEADTEFVIKMAKGDWRHFENNKDASSNKVVIGSAIDESEALHNFKASAEGTYTFYISKDKEAEGGKGVYIGYTAPSSSGGEDPTPHVANEVTLYLTANWGGWESPKAYVFNNDSQTSKVAWPGENMTYVGVNDDNHTIFSYTVDIALYDRVIFSNGAGGDSNQTVDIDISAAVDKDAYFLKQRVDGNDANKIEVEKWGPFSDSALTSKKIIYFTNNFGWSNVHFYVFNSATQAKEADWPGHEAKWVCKNEHNQDVYRLVVSNDYDAFIFNGDGNQTVDILLSSLEEGKNAFFISEEKEGNNFKVGQWAYNPLP